VIEMMGLSMQDHWYAIFVRTGQEEIICQKLDVIFGDQVLFYVFQRRLKERKGGRWNEVLRTLYPGYIIANGYINADDYYKINHVDGVIKVLANEREPLKMVVNEIEIIKKLMDDDGTIDFSTVFVEGSTVTIVDGPLATLEGIVQSYDLRKQRARIKLTFLGEDRVIDLGINILEKVD